jgi:alpha,alpha-trehalose phosphorylase
MRDYDGRLTFDPRLPSKWGRLRFPIRFHDTRIEVDLTHDEFKFRIIDGPAISITVLGDDHTLSPGTPLTVVPPA